MATRFGTQWRKSVTAERFISTMRNEIYKYMTSIWKYMYIDKLNETNIVEKLLRYVNIFANFYTPN